MPKKCKPCMSGDIKDLLTEQYPELTSILVNTPECEDGSMLNICSRGTKKKSEYNLFIGECMRAKKIKGFGNAAPAMRECAAKWKQRGK